MNKEEAIKLWLQSGKKHLLITGDLGRGKTTLFQSLMDELNADYISSQLQFEDTMHPVSVELYSSTLKESIVIAKRLNCSLHQTELLDTRAVQYVNDMSSSIVGVDEIGYLENSSATYIEALNQLFEKKQVVACLRSNKGSDIVERIKSRDDVYLIDLNQISYLVDCVVMASGHSRRYGTNKLLEPWKETTLIDTCLSQIPYDMLNEVLVVTRYKEVKELCKQYPVRVILHEEEYQSDTIRLGIEALGPRAEAIMFLTCDQPLRTKRSISSMILESNTYKENFIQLAFKEKRGNPVIFPRCYEEELKALRKEETGKVVLRKYPGRIREVSAAHAYELVDIDTKERYVELIRKVKKCI